MSDNVISVENLSKRYFVGHRSARHESYTALRDVLARGARNLVRRAGDLVMGRQVLEGDAVEEFWALRDVSFTVARGEVLGIIGRNGAGKSTLFKVLSRITEPTTGRIRIKGRVASLLEVGTGFHPELTGRENIYLNGAILGMTKADIRKRFDEIVAFAEVERFLDTPVKRYSSGMYVRLAFAVAAHLEPDILIVDEVLAVGDAEFQKKCLGKMSEVSRQSGRTVLFVSHNMGAVRALCRSSLVLQAGRVLFSGDTADCIREYEHTAQRSVSSEWARDSNSPIVELGLTRIEARVRGRQPDQVLEITCSLAGISNHRAAMISFEISDKLGTILMQALPEFNPFIKLDKAKAFRFEVQLPPLIPGKYWLSVWLGPHGEVFDLLPECLSFEIHESPTAGRPFAHDAAHGFLAPACTATALSED
jgi:lipopolysaccharide transport system ATP-binding protein